MGPVRTEVMWQSVLDAVEAVSSATSGLDVLDLGGGTGGDAVRLARLGHRVTVVDPSPDALASLDRRAAESDLDTSAGHGSVTGILGDTADLMEHVAPASFDLVVCHGVLEHVDDPDQALAAAAQALRPGGYVSVVVAGRLGAVVSRALAGDFAEATSLFESNAGTWDLRAAGPRRFVVDEVTALLTAHGFTPEQTNALRVFADLVPSALVDVEPGARDRLFALERLVRTAPDLTAVSGGLQSIARLDLGAAPSDRGGRRATV
ncbi:class I SAM-dependent methyltransferase [Aeromicrobium sp.]|uniref:class I SAM-dependent methyltransferase n=1 Tax=Aeromicrobium sp. TaxID=1871063 RepID=UPI003D6B897A